MFLPDRFSFLTVYVPVYVFAYDLGFEFGFRPMFIIVLLYFCPMFKNSLVSFCFFRVFFFFLASFRRGMIISLTEILQCDTFLDM